MRAKLLIPAVLWTVAAGAKIFGQAESPQPKRAPVPSATSEDAPALARVD